MNFLRVFSAVFLFSLAACGGEGSAGGGTGGGGGGGGPTPPPVETTGPNLVFIVVDDLNDYVQGFGGHPQAYTPNMQRLAARGVTFTNTHANAPLCSPSRASMLSGYLPTTSGKYFSTHDFRSHPLLANATLLPQHFRDNGYAVYSAGKIFHGTETDNTVFGTKDPLTIPQTRDSRAGGYMGPKSDFGPIPWDGVTYFFGSRSRYIPGGIEGRDWEEIDGITRVLAGGAWNSNPDMPRPVREWVFGHGRLSQPPVFTEDMNSRYPAGHRYSGFAQDMTDQPFRYVSESDRSLISDEKISKWAVDLLSARPVSVSGFENTAPIGGRGFAMFLGLVKPHAALYSPDIYYDEFIAALGLRTIDDVQLPPLYEGQFLSNDFDDVPDSGRLGAGLGRFRAIVAGGDEGGTIRDLLNPGQRIPNTRESLLRSMVLSYLVAIYEVDVQLGRILDAIESNPTLNANTIIIVTSDHGWSAGEKRSWGKNNLWSESTRVPLIISAPGTAYDPTRGSVTNMPSTLVDLYRTLIALANLPPATLAAGAPDIDGQNLVPALLNPASPQMPRRPVAVMSMNARQADVLGSNDPALRNHSIRTERWRYTLTFAGEEELYDLDNDPNEWTNLAGRPAWQNVLENMRALMRERVRNF